MDSEPRRRQVSTVRSWPRSRLAVRSTTVGLAISAVTVILSAFNAVSTRQSIALALLAALTTIGGMIGWLVPDAWIAWRRGFQRGCETALTSQTYRLSADVTAQALREIQIASAANYPPTHYCAVCGRGYS
jgi:hypothetical protein